MSNAHLLHLTVVIKDRSFMKFDFGILAKSFKFSL